MRVVGGGSKLRGRLPHLGCTGHPLVVLCALMSLIKDTLTGEASICKASVI